jgi:hypothetical protein
METDNCFAAITSALYSLVEAKKCEEESPTEALVRVEYAKSYLKEALRLVREIEEGVAKQPLKAFPSRELLNQFDAQYFDLDPDNKKWTEERACYRLATWLYDRNGKGLKDIEEVFGRAVMLRVRRFYKNGNHDT